ncbi:MAG: hypothetical protein OXR73_21270, partial [Myxococcales bacterium]|nr:hypothetical protein [Myxococcales bacterium]
PKAHLCSLPRVPLPLRGRQPLPCTGKAGDRRQCWTAPAKALCLLLVVQACGEDVRPYRRAELAMAQAGDPPGPPPPPARTHDTAGGETSDFGELCPTCDPSARPTDPPGLTLACELKPTARTEETDQLVGLPEALERLAEPLTLAGKWAWPEEYDRYFNVSGATLPEPAETTVLVEISLDVAESELNDGRPECNLTLLVPAVVKLVVGSGTLTARLTGTLQLSHGQRPYALLRAGGSLSGATGDLNLGIDSTRPHAAYVRFFLDLNDLEATVSPMVGYGFETDDSLDWQFDEPPYSLLSPVERADEYESINDLPGEDEPCGPADQPFDALSGETPRALLERALLAMQQAEAPNATYQDATVGEPSLEFEPEATGQVCIRRHDDLLELRGDPGARLYTTDGRVDLELAHFSLEVHMGSNELRSMFFAWPEFSPELQSFLNRGITPGVIGQVVDEELVVVAYYLQEKPFTSSGLVSLSDPDAPGLFQLAW